MKKINFKILLFFLSFLYLIFTQTVPEKPSSREISNFIKRNPKITEKRIAELFLMYEDCQRLVGYVNALSPKEISSLKNLAEYKNGHCFKIPSTTIEINDEILGFSSLSEEISSKITESSLAIRNSLARFNIISNLFKTSEDIVDNDRVSRTFLLSQAQLNSCIAPSLLEIYKISAKRRSILYATISQLESGCIKRDNIYVDCEIAYADFINVWNIWTDISGCLLGFYNNLATSLTQSLAMISQFQKCRVEGNSNMEATTTLSRNLQTNVTVIKYKFYTPRKSINCGSKIFPKYSTNDLSIDKIKVDSTVENEFNNTLLKEKVKRNALLASTFYETCYQDKIYFDVNGKYVIPIPDSVYDRITFAISKFEKAFLTVDIKVDSLLFYTRVNQVIDNNSEYDASCADILEILRPQFTNFNKLIKIKENAINFINTNTVDNYWFYCSYDTTLKSITCKCYIGNCANFITSAEELVFLLKDTSKKWVLNYESIMFSIWKANGTFAYFTKYSLAYTIPGSTTTIYDRKYEFVLDNARTNSFACNQINGCNKIEFSDYNSKTDRQSCFGLLKDTCRWDMNIKLEDYKSTLMLFNAFQHMPYRNIATPTTDQLSFIYNFFFNGFNLNYNFIVDAPLAIASILYTQPAASNINYSLIDTKSEVVDDSTTTTSSSSSETTSNAVGTRRNLQTTIDFGNIFETASIQVNPNNYLFINGSSQGYNPKIEEGTVNGIGNVNFYINDYEAAKSSFPSINLLALIVYLFIVN